MRCLLLQFDILKHNLEVQVCLLIAGQLRPKLHFLLHLSVLKLQFYQLTLQFLLKCLFAIDAMKKFTFLIVFPGISNRYFLRFLNLIEFFNAFLDFFVIVIFPGLQFPDLLRIKNDFLRLIIRVLANTKAIKSSIQLSELVIVDKAIIHFAQNVHLLQLLRQLRPLKLQGIHLRLPLSRLNDNVLIRIRGALSLNLSG